MLFENTDRNRYIILNKTMKSIIEGKNVFLNVLEMRQLNMKKSRHVFVYNYSLSAEHVYASNLSRKLYPAKTIYFRTFDLLLKYVRMLFLYNSLDA